jgi:hypothetical protein
MTEDGKHYKNKLITADMVGQPLDPALFESIHPMPMMLSQAFKKIVFAGNRGKKDKIQDLKDAIGAIQRQMEIYGLENESVNEFVSDMADKHSISFNCKSIDFDELTGRPLIDLKSEHMINWKAGEEIIPFNSDGDRCYYEYIGSFFFKCITSGDCFHIDDIVNAYTHIENKTKNVKFKL